jgi:hypothetical protein
MARRFAKPRGRLTGRQLIFVLSYMQSGNATRAAVEAGYCAGLSCAATSRQRRPRPAPASEGAPLAATNALLQPLRRGAYRLAASIMQAISSTTAKLQERPHQPLVV